MGGGPEFIVHNYVTTEKADNLLRLWTARANEIYRGDFRDKMLDMFNKPAGVPSNLYEDSRGCHWPPGMVVLVLVRSDSTTTGIAFAAKKNDPAMLVVSYWAWTM